MVVAASSLGPDVGRGLYAVGQIKADHTVCYYTGLIFNGNREDSGLAVLTTVAVVKRDPRPQGGLAWLINLGHKEKVNLVPVEVRTYMLSSACPCLDVVSAIHTPGTHAQTT